MSRIFVSHRPLLLAGAVLFFALLQPSTALFAQPPRALDPGAIDGLVLDEDGEPIAGVEVRLVDLYRVTTSHDDGSFRFAQVPAGEHLLEAGNSASGQGVVRVDVPAGGVAPATLRLEISHFSDSVVVSASGDPRSRLELAQATTVLDGDELRQRLEPSLGETLAGQPGIASTSFGTAASRPVIRGLGGDRVALLENGLGTGDASSTSPDHAVSAEPLTAERIEVLRGPATLLYGSNAIGGAVNVISSRIPSYRGTGRLTGWAEMRGASAADARTGSVSVDGGEDEWAWHLDFQRRDAEEYTIPGFAELESAHAEHDDEHDEEHDEEEERAFGFVPNSDLSTASGAFGFSRFFGDSGMIGVSISGLDSEYGLPGGHAHEHEGEGEGEGAQEEDEAVRLDLQSRRADLRGELYRDFGPFRGLKLRLGAVDYEHVELEGQEVGTRFFNDYQEARLELVQRRREGWTGSLGVQLKARDLEAIGDEAFLPPTETESFALFTLQELERGALRWQLGARYEHQRVATAAAALPDRSFDGASASLGAVWQPRDGWALALSAARSVKLPNAEELYSDGLHVATRSFELGDPALEQENSLGLELGVRKESGRLTGELSVYSNRFQDFIFARFTGEREEGFPVVRYTQADAGFRGAELDLRYGLWETDDNHLDLELFGDVVRAELRADDRPLPRIPPLSYGAGLHYHRGLLTAGVEVRRVERQHRVAENETPTAGYTRVDAAFGYRFVIGEQLVDLMLRGTNLTDEEIRNHLSVLKDEVPSPGRDLGLALRFWF